MNILRNNLKEQDINKIPPAPQVLFSLIDLFNQTDINFPQLESIIKKDVALLSKVLNLANSAAYSQWNNISELRQILVVLGTKTLKNITITATVHQFFSQFDVQFDELMGRLWLDALVCAHLAKKLAILTDYDNADEAYLGGLLHQLGQLIFLANHPQLYKSILQQSKDQNALLFQEQQHFGINSSNLAADIIEAWPIGNNLQSAIRYQYKHASLIQNTQALVKIINLASTLTNRLNHLNNIYQVEDNFFNLNQSVIDDLLSQATDAACKDATGFGIKVDSKSSSPVAIINHQNVRQQLADKVQQIALLSGINQQSEAFENTADMMKLVSENLQMLFGLSSNMFFFPDPEQKFLTGIASHNKNIQKDHSFIIELKQGQSLITQSALEKSIIDSAQQIFFSELPAVDLQILSSLKSPYLLCLPLVNQQQLISVIAIGCEQHQIDMIHSKHDFVTQFCNIIAHGIVQQKQASIELQQQQQLQQQEFNLHIRKIIHEVNNPLTVINNYLEIIAMELDEDSVNKQHIETVKLEIERVGDLLLQLRNDQDINFEKNVEELPEVDINQLITNLNALFKPTFYKNNNISCQLELDPALPLILCNQSKLKQILSNLIKNATESLTADGIISIRTKALIIINNSKFIQISIADNGDGIPESILENLFSPVQSTKGLNHSGLGLTIVNKLVSELKGSISYNTSDLGGAEFTILLPRN